MKKFLSVLTLALSLVLCIVALASCGDKGDGENQHEHTWLIDYTVDKEANCTENGEKSIRCIECNEVKEGSVVVIPASHDWSSQVTTDKPATCTEDGQKSVKCTKCSAVKEGSVVVIPAGHNWSATVTEDKAPTCTEDGKKSVKCTVCNTVKADSVVVTPAAHTWSTTVTEDKAATCTEDGLRTIRCTVCNEIKPGSEAVIPAAHKWGTTVSVDKAATCTEDGQHSVRCTVCNEVKEGSVTVVPAGHVWATEPTVDTPFSCTESGVQSIKCTLCGEVDEDSVSVIPAGHRWDSKYTVLVAATCSETGKKGVKCSLCGKLDETTVATIPALAHEWEDAPTVDIAATCTEDGQQSIKCLVCQTPKEGSVEVIPFGHSWSTLLTYDFRPTCTTDGQQSLKCKVCKEIKPGSIKVIPGGHTWSGVTTVDFPATCTENGQKSEKCLECNEIKESSVVVIPKSHDYSMVEIKIHATAFNEGYREGVCIACNEEIKEILPATTVNTLQFSGSGGVYKDSTPLSGVLADGDHFYPTEDNPDGNDLYVEFSILLNKTIDNLVGESMGVSGIRNENSGNGNTPYWFYFSPDARWCPYKGGLEVDSIDELIFGASGNDVSVPDDYFVLENYYGWHRFGWKLHQDTIIDETGRITYKITTSFYVDGFKVSEYVPYNWMEENYLYFAQIIDGEVVYTDNTNASKHVFYYRIEDAYTSDGSTAYLPIADLSVSYGDDFLLPVVPVTNPQNVQYELPGGMKVNGMSHFRVYDDEEGEEHEHIWTNVATVDKVPTCQEEGQKSIKCALCGEINPDEIIILPKNSRHNVDRYEVIVAATMFTEGFQEGKCTDCGHVNTQILTTTIANARKLESTKPSSVTYKFSMLDVLDGDHFYPTETDPDGKDLYIELSLLWNESLHKTKDGVMNLGRISLGNATDGNGLYYLYFKDTKDGTDTFDAGAIDVGSLDHFLTGPGSSSNPSGAEGLSIGAYGWHRIGIRVHQEVTVTDGKIKYNVTSYLYIDGEIVSSQVCDMYDSNLLYYAKLDADGNLVYLDNNFNDRHIYAYRLDGFNTTNASDTAFFVTADVHVSCGNDFISPVKKVENPIADTYTTSGNTFDGTVFYEHIKPTDVVFPEPPCYDHVDANDDCICDNDGCNIICVDGCDVNPCVDKDDNGICDNKWCKGAFTDGCDVVECLDRDHDGYCDNEDCDKATDNKSTVCEHDYLKYTVTVYQTLFSKGEKTAYCPICEENIVIVIDETVPDVIIRDSSLKDNNTNMKVWHNSVPLASLTDDNTHFYPTEDDADGKSLFVEFSMLVNETFDLATKNGKAWFLPGVISRNDGYSQSLSEPFYMHIDSNDTTWCPFAGGIEPGYTVDNFYESTVASERYANGNTYYAMENFYGWHRFGVQYTQTAEKSGNSVSYTMYATLYIDGVKVMTVKSDSWIAENLLYTAEIENGELVYSDNKSDDRSVTAAILQYFIPSDGTMYVPMADVFITCGNEFVVGVTPVEEPEDATFEVANGITVDAKAYYALGEFNYAPPTPPVKCRHDKLPYTTLVYATMFSKGENVAHCDVCGEDIRVEVEGEVTTVSRPSSLSNNNTNMKVWYNSVPLASLTDEGNHFYPTKADADGKSLFVEFSMLVNETFDLATKNGKAWFIPAAISRNDYVSSTISEPFYMHIDANDTEWCPFAGGIENGFTVENFYESDVASEKSVDGKTYYAMDDFYGWHRFGVQYTQTVEIVDGEVVYTMHATLYIDGVKVMDEVSSSWIEENLLYTAEVVDGKLVYSDNKRDDRIVTAAILQYFIPNTDTMYVPLADAFISCGNEFIMDVSYEADAEAEAFELPDGTAIDATRYFKFNGVLDITCHHYDADDDGICDKTGCGTSFTDGCDLGSCVDANDDCLCDNDACKLPYVDGCDVKNCVDKDDDGKCDNDCCNKSFTDGCDTVDCLDTDGDGYCNNKDCNKETDNKLVICDHSALDYVTTVFATMFSKGEKISHCDVCGEDVVAVVDETVADVVTRPSSLSNNGTNMKVWYNSVPLASLTDNNTHFYPTENDADGKSLFVEFSMLVNETFSLATKNGKAWFIPAAISRNDYISSTISEPFYMHIDANDTTWCPFAGGIENGFTVENFYESDVASEKSVGGKTYYAMDDFYGWHRFGVQYTQTAEILGGIVEYVMYVTLYIDGVKVMEERSVNWIAENLLYTAEIDGDELVYSDNKRDDRIVTASILQYFIPSSGTMYIPMADVFISCGDEFIMDVSYAEAPAAETFELPGGTVIDTTRYFDFNGVPEYVCKHRDANDDGECDNVGCYEIFFDGCDVVECKDIDGDGLCDNDECGKPLPVCDHDNLVYETSIYPTMYSNGRESAYCPACKQEISYSTGTTTPSIIKRTSQSGSNGTFKGTIPINELLGEGEHFYPTEDDADGKSLFVEYSILFNETVDLSTGACWALPGFRDKNSGNSNGSYWLYLRDNYEPTCPFQGGIEINNDADEYLSGKTFTTSCDPDDYIIIDNIYGWHRFGVEFKQKAWIDNGNVKYSMTVSLYIDGTLMSTFVDYDSWDAKNLLYTAEIVNGELVYHDSTVSDRYLYLYRMEKFECLAEETIYLPIADLYVSCGDDFCVDVDSLEEPIEETFDLFSGYSVDAPRYFEVVTE